MDVMTFFRDVVGIQDQEVLDVFAGNATSVALQKGDCVLKAGDAQEQVSFLVSGIARTCSVDMDGHDVTDCLICEPGSALAPSVDLTRPSIATIEMLTDGETIAVSIEAIMGLLETSLAANKIYIRIISQAWQEHWEARRLLSQKRGRERYLWFLKRYPGVIDRIPNRYVASLLGMTPVSLSRLRSELRSEGVIG